MTAHEFNPRLASLSARAAAYQSWADTPDRARRTAPRQSAGGAE